MCLTLEVDSEEQSLLKAEDLSVQSLQDTVAVSLVVGSESGGPTTRGRRALSAAA